MSIPYPDFNEQLNDYISSYPAYNVYCLVYEEDTEKYIHLKSNGRRVEIDWKKYRANINHSEFDYSETSTDYYECTYVFFRKFWQ
jgi:hypothetical protein